MEPVQLAGAEAEVAAGRECQNEWKGGVAPVDLGLLFLHLY